MATSCVILAGGKSLRLGHDKVTATVGKSSLLQEVVSRVSALCSDIIIVTAERQNIPQLESQPLTRIVTDVFPGRGPLGGIYSGLAASDSHLNLVVAGDMPFLNAALLSYMLRLADGFDMVVPRVGSLVEPLHAVYSRNCLPAAADLIRQNKLNVTGLFGLLKVRFVEAAEIDRFDPQHRSFFNINTRTDLAKARELAGKEEL